VWYIAYLILHLLLYVLVLRRLITFRREIVIFAYHAVSIIVVGAAVLAGVVLTWATADVYEAVAIVALHAIYSISFLEVWSLSEGGYSLQIMEHLALAERQNRPADLEALRAIGIAKQGNRLDGLASVGLVRQTDATVELTTAGRLVATVFAGLAWLTHVRDGV
jgi:hypothetical protein